MLENGIMSSDRLEWRFLVWIRDFYRGVSLYFRRITDPSTNYRNWFIPEPLPEEVETLAEDFDIVEVDNVDDTIIEMPG